MHSDLGCPSRSGNKLDDSAGLRERRANGASNAIDMLSLGRQRCERKLQCVPSMCTFTNCICKEWHARPVEDRSNNKSYSSIGLSGGITMTRQILEIIILSQVFRESLQTHRPFSSNC